MTESNSLWRTLSLISATLASAAVVSSSIALTVYYQAGVGGWENLIRLGFRGAAILSLTASLGLVMAKISETEDENSRFYTVKQISWVYYLVSVGTVILFILGIGLLLRMINFMSYAFK